MTEKPKQQISRFDSQWSQHFSKTSLIESSNVVFDFLERNSALILIPVVMTMLVGKNLSIDALFIVIYFLLTTYSYLEVLPLAILCIPPIAIDFQSACYSLSRLEQCENTVIQREELSVVGAIVLSHIFVLSKHHRYMAIFLLEVTGTQPQVILAGVMVLSFACTIIFGQMHAFALLHPINTVVLQMVLNCKKIALSHEGAAKADYYEYRLGFNKLSVAVRLALPFTIAIATPSILFDYVERKRSLDSDTWLVFVALPMAFLQTFCVWIFLVGKFFGFKKYFNWKGTMEDVYLTHLIVTEKEKLKESRMSIVMKVETVLLYIALFRFILRILWNTKISVSRELSMNENATTMVLFVTYFILYEVGQIRLTLMNDIDSDEFISTDVVYYVLASNMYCSNFMGSSIREYIWEYALVPEEAGFIFRILIFTLTFTIITNFLHTTCLFNIWRFGSEKLIKELWFSECLATTTLNFIANYSFLFPFSSSVNLMAYTSGGIPKKQLFVSGTHVLMICYSISLLVLFGVVPFFDFQYIIRTPGFGDRCKLITGRDYYFKFYNHTEIRELSGM